MARVLAGGVGAMLATLLAHFVNVVVGDAVASLAGFLVGYALAGLLSPSRAPPAPARFDLATRKPAALDLLRRLSVAAAALAFYFGDRLLYALGMHGLPRKLAAVAVATLILAVGFWLTEWPRPGSLNSL